MSELSPLSELPRKQRDRLAFIEIQAWFCGEVSRQNVVSRFAVKTAAATRDLALYRTLAPDNLEFNDSRKCYHPTANFSPLFEFDPERVSTWLNHGFGDDEPLTWDTGIPCTSTEQLSRPKLSHLAAICRAIRQKRAVEIEYESLNESSTRVIAPFALHNNAQRWHVRAFDRKKDRFGDFVLTRITTVKPAGEIASHESISEDDQWNWKVELELVPHPDLERPHPVILDYGFDETLVKKVKVRAAVAGYALRQWGVDCSENHTLNPREHQLWLRNRLALYGVETRILALGYGDSSTEK